MSNIIYTPKTIWQDFDDNLPLEVEVLSSFTQNQINFKNLYISGREVDNSRPRIFVVSATKNSDVAILYVGDLAQNSIQEEILPLCEFADVYSFDYFGESNKEFFTKYPESIEFANYLSSGRHFLYADEDAKKTCLYEWCGLAKFVLTFIKSKNYKKVAVVGMGIGGNIATILSGSDNRVDCGISIFGAGGEKYEGKPKFAIDQVEVGEEFSRYVAGVGAESYAQHIKIPFLYLTCTNNSSFDFDRAFDMLSRVDAKYLHFSISERLNHNIGFRELELLRLFLSKYLLGENVEIAKQPELSAKVVDYKINFNVAVFGKPKTVKIFYCTELEPAIRNWKEILVDTNNNAQIKIFEGEQIVFAFAKVIYENKYSLCSKLWYSDVSDIQKLQDKSLQHILYINEYGVDTLTTFSEDNVDFCNIVLSKKSTEFVEGSNKIWGVQSNFNCLASYKIKQAENVSSISFDINSKLNQTVVLELIEDYKQPSENRYRYSFEVTGEDAWQSICISFDEIKSNLKKPLKSLKKVQILLLRTECDAVFNNILWL